MGNELLRASTGPRDWLVGQLTRMFGDNRTAAEYANKAADAFDYTGAGAVTTGAYEGGNALARAVGDPSKQNVLAAGLTAASMLPFVKGIRGAARSAARDAASTANMGIKAFHGSPHDFERFSTEHIGTGEGAQAFGHGLYFAGNEGVARSYKEGLSTRDTGLRWKKSEDPSEEDIAQFMKMRDNYEYGKHQHTFSEDPVRNLGQLRDMYQRNAESAMENPNFAPEHRVKVAEHQQKQALSAQTMQDWAIANQHRLDVGRGGHMYEVDIDAHPSEFADWDKLSPEMREALKDPSKVAEMRAEGIPGVKYLDQGSRSAGEGTHNYVVFDDNMVNILRKYGIAPGAYGAWQLQQQSQGDQPAQSPPVMPPGYSGS